MDFAVIQSDLGVILKKTDQETGIRAALTFQMVVLFGVSNDLEAGVGNSFLLAAILLV